MHFLVGISLIRFLPAVPLEPWSIQQAWFWGPGTGERVFLKSSLILNSSWNQRITVRMKAFMFWAAAISFPITFNQSGGLHWLQTVGRWPARDYKLPLRSLSREIFPVKEDGCNLSDPVLSCDSCYRTELLSPLWNGLRCHTDFHTCSCNQSVTY